MKTLIEFAEQNIEGIIEKLRRCHEEQSVMVYEGENSGLVMGYVQQGHFPGGEFLNFGSGFNRGTKVRERDLRAYVEDIIASEKTFLVEGETY